MYLSESLIDRLKTQHFQVGEVYLKFPLQLIIERKNPEKWSAYENLAHLVRYQQVFIERIIRILSQDQPAFERYKAEEDPEFSHFQHQSLQYLWQQMKKDRKQIIEMAEKLSEINWYRTGMHPKFGTLTLVEWFDFFLLHEAHHLFTIFQLLHDPPA